MATLTRAAGTVFAVALAIGALGIVALFLVVPQVLGGATLTVLTGSMSPTIPQGSVVLIKPVEDLEAIEPGTVITFQKSPTEHVLVTHRVVRFQPDTTPPSYITKGDANRGEDIDPVPIGAVRGEVIAHVPHLGRISAYLGGTRGPFLIGAAVAISVILTQTRKLIGAIRDQDSDDQPDDVDHAAAGPPPPPPDSVDLASITTSDRN